MKRWVGKGVGLCQLHTYSVHKELRFFREVVVNDIVQCGDVYTACLHITAVT